MFGSVSSPQGQRLFIVESPVMRDFMALVQRVARHSGAVLIQGETGTGKETIANLVHEQSLRSGRPFVDINCGALPEHLVESELFGYEKGAFSGAETTKPGLFEVANSGTIFLDEIGELDLKIQVKLLRVLDRAPYYRLGGSRKIAADVRVVAATNRDLKEEVKAGRFRKDLYHRLSQFELRVPPLRERPEDIAVLANHLLETESSQLTFTPDAITMLQEYAWPGNVRELQNTVSKLAIHNAGSDITADEVREHLQTSEIHEQAHATLTPSFLEPQTEIEFDEQAIRSALQKTKGHRGQAAAELGISRRTLSRKLRSYGFSSKYGSTPAPVLPDDEGRQSYRAEMRVPVTLCRPDGTEIACHSTNLSETGLGIDGLEVPIGPHLFVKVKFRLPDAQNTLKTTARLAWDDKRGGVGLLFTALDSSASHEIRSWLLTRMSADGWRADNSLPSLTATGVSSD